MSSENPYQAPQSGELGAAADPAAEGSPVKHDVLIIVLSVLCLLIVGGGGSYLVYRLIFPPGYYPGFALSTFFWISWGARVVGGFTGQLVAGALLGRYLKRVRPRYVLWGIVLYIAGASIVELVVFFDAGHAVWLDTVGPVGALVQRVGHLAVLLAVVYGGILLGRKAQREAEQKAAKRQAEQIAVEKAQVPAPASAAVREEDVNHADPKDQSAMR